MKSLIVCKTRGTYLVTKGGLSSKLEVGGIL